MWCEVRVLNKEVLLRLTTAPNLATRSITTHQLNDSTAEVKLEMEGVAGDLNKVSSKTAALEVRLEVIAARQTEDAATIASLVPPFTPHPQQRTSAWMHCLISTGMGAQ